MVYSLFDQDEKDKITESFNSLGIPTGVSVSESQQSTDDVALQNKALEDIIARQQKEEQAIKDDYDSLGSRANRFLQVFGAGLRGENASGVAKDLRDNLNTRLTNIRSKYKDDRDAAYQRVKDTLARREALAQAEYNRSRDQAKDEQWSKEQATKQDQFDRQMKYNYDQLNLNQQEKKNKEDQALKQAELEAQNKLKNKVGLEMKISNAISTGVMNPGGWSSLPFSSDKDLKGSTLDSYNIQIAKDKFGIDAKDAADFIKKNPDVFPNKNDPKNVVKAKYENLGYKSIKSISQPDSNNRQLVTYNDDSQVIYDANLDQFIEVE